MLKIFGDATSRAGRVVWCARELGLDHQIVPVDFMRGEHKQPAYLAINPMGQVPAIDDGGFKMAESLAIPLYLAMKVGSPLAPQTPEEHGRLAQWSLCLTGSVEPYLIHVIANRMALPPEHRREALAVAALERLAPALGAIDQAVARSGWLLGDRFTVADLNVASVLAPLVAAGTSLRSTAALETWLAACLGRPAAEGQAMPIHFPPPIVARYLAENP